MEAEAIATLGGLDCLITNAGGPPTGSFEKDGDGDWDVAYQPNLMSAVRLICAYLCSPQAGYITGQTIVVDGGINRSI